ncbi:MAG TPA: hypothetical protein VHV77_13120 [Pirellulales bacterium]|jgi:hypothetical protein|nr:hypothetical protein [Pirellulales bacterium]
MLHDDRRARLETRIVVVLTVIDEQLRAWLAVISQKYAVDVDEVDVLVAHQEFLEQRVQFGLRLARLPAAVAIRKTIVLTLRGIDPVLRTSKHGFPRFIS